MHPERRAQKEERPIITPFFEFLIFLGFVIEGRKISTEDEISGVQSESREINLMLNFWIGLVP